MAESRRLCKAHPKNGSSCPHYAVIGDYCARHMGSGLTRECTRHGCTATALMLKTECRFHHILSLAECLHDQAQLDELRAALADVTVLDQAARDQARVDTYLGMVRRSVDDIHRYRQMAEQYGATAEQIDAAIGEPPIPVP